MFAKPTAHLCSVTTSLSLTVTLPGPPWRGPEDYSASTCIMHLQVLKLTQLRLQSPFHSAQVLGIGVGTNPQGSVPRPPRGPPADRHVVNARPSLGAGRGQGLPWATRARAHLLPCCGGQNLCFCGSKTKGSGGSRAVDVSDDGTRAVADSGLPVLRGPALTALPGQKLQGPRGGMSLGCGKGGRCSQTG